MAKKKMLGNIKFIGELGKLQIVHDSILHRCCEQLLVGRRKQPLSDQAEDLECLCHLFRTCGRILDTPKAKVRMDQYFDRLKAVVDGEHHPVRIKFLVQDVIEMRRNRWMPRKIGKTPEGPRTIQQVREDAYRDGCIYMPQASSPPGGLKTGTSVAGGMMGHGFLNPLEGSFFDGKPKGGKAKAQDFFGGYGGGGAGGYLGMGPGVIHSDNFDEHKEDSNRYEPNNSPPARGANTMNNGYHKNGSDRNSYGGGGGDHFNKHERSPPHHNQQQQQQQPQRHHQQQQQQHSFDADEKGDYGRNNDDRGYYQDNYDGNRRGGGGDRGGNFNHYQRAPDFGDRYSANRSKDRERRQQFGGPQQQQQQHQQQRNNQDRFNDNRSFNNDNRNFGGDNNRKFDRYENRGYGNRNNGPPRDGIMRSDGGNYHNDNNSSSDQAGPNLAPRFKRMQTGNQQPNNQHGGYRQGPYHGGPPAGVSGPDGGQVSPTPNQLSSNNRRDNSDVVSLRPQSANNMLFKPKTPSMLPKSAIRGQESSPLGENSLLGPPLPSAPAKVMMQQKEAPIVIKQGSLDKGRKDKNKGNKGPTREEVFARMETIMAELLEHKSAATAVDSWKENNWLPSKMSQTAATHFFKISLCKQEREAERELGLQFMEQLVKDGALNATHCQEALSKIISSHLTELDKAFDGEEAAGKRRVSEAAAWLLGRDLLTFKEMTETMRGANNHPLFLFTLSQLKELWGEEKLKEAFDAAKPKMTDFVELNKGSSEEQDESLLKALDEQGLSFLLPLLAVRRDMSKRLADDPTPANFAKWLQEDESLSGFHGRPEFVMALFKIVLGRVTSQTTLAEGASTAQQPDKAASEAERDALDKFRPVLQPFVRDRPDLQLAAVYALQVFCFEKGYPKGLLLRSFVNFYELDIMDEQAFLKWKEDVNDTYPGKGKALFQASLRTQWIPLNRDQFLQPKMS